MFLTVSIFYLSLWKVKALEVEFFLTEEQPFGTKVGSLISKLSNSFMTYSPLVFTKTEREPFFKVQPDNGDVIVSNRIDRDALCDMKVASCCKSSSSSQSSVSSSTKNVKISSSSACHIAFHVTLRGKSTFLQVIKVKVFILDLNDNAPYWPGVGVLRLSVEEENPHPSPIPLMKAVDPDLGENATQTYRLQSPYDDRLFSISVPNIANPYQELAFNIHGKLDREMRSQYNFTLIAFDGGRPVPKSGSVAILLEVLDSNDHAPWFEHVNYFVKVPEAKTIHRPILTVRATDRDAGMNAEVEYDFGSTVSEGIHQLFEISKTTGEVTLKSPLDYEMQQQYSFTVVASDHGALIKRNFTQVIVQVMDENDNSPEITILSTMDDMRSGDLFIKENTPLGQTIAVISVSDLDAGEAGRIKCYLMSSEAHSFQSSGFSGSESQGKGNDRNGAVADNNILLLEENIDNSGQLLLKIGTTQLDRETRANYHFTLHCYDHGNPARESQRTISLKLIDVNDCEPTFTQSSYGFHVAEDKPVGYAIGKVLANDADSEQNGRVFYSIDWSDSSPQAVTATPDISYLDWFSIDRNKGLIRVSQALDRELIQECKFSVIAQDGGDPPLSSRVPVNIRIMDVNDEIPSFNDTHYRFSINENVPPGTFVGYVWAHDRDDGINSQLSFHIDKYFERFLPFVLNVVGGEQRHVAKLMTSKLIDREKMANLAGSGGGSSSGSSGNAIIQGNTYNFDIIVKDGGNPSKQSTASITVYVIDENDNSPQFSYPPRGSATVNVSGSAAVGDKVVVIQATDADEGDNARVYYTITSGNDNDVFVLDPHSGTLQIRRTLKQEDFRSYNLIIEARNEPSFPLVMTTESFVEKDSATRSVVIKYNQTGELRILNISSANVTPSTALTIQESQKRQIVMKQLAFLRIFIVDNGSPPGASWKSHDGRSVESGNAYGNGAYSGDGGSAQLGMFGGGNIDNITLTIILALVVCTAAVVFILILAIVFSRITRIRNRRRRFTKEDPGMHYTTSSLAPAFARRHIGEEAMSGTVVRSKDGVFLTTKTAYDPSQTCEVTSTLHNDEVSYTQLNNQEDWNTREAYQKSDELPGNAHYDCQGNYSTLRQFNSSDLRKGVPVNLRDSKFCRPSFPHIVENVFDPSRGMDSQFHGRHLLLAGSTLCVSNPQGQMDLTSGCHLMKHHHSSTPPPLGRISSDTSFLEKEKSKIGGILVVEKSRNCENPSLISGGSSILSNKSNQTNTSLEINAPQKMGRSVLYQSSFV